MPPDDDLESPDTGEATPPASPVPPPASVSLTPDQVRASPEFRALERQNRKLARDAGTSNAALAAAREDAENARQAAEAERQTVLQQQLVDALGPDGVAVYQEIADLTATDPMAGALRVAELVRAAQGQTPPVPVAVAAAARIGEAGNVPANAAASSAPPPPNQGLDGGTPLGQASTGEDLDQIVSGLTANYTEIVTRNQSIAGRNRVTMRERAKALISYLGASYLSAGASPKNPK